MVSLCALSVKNTFIDVKEINDTIIGSKSMPALRSDTELNDHIVTKGDKRRVKELQ